MDISCVILTWNSERYIEKCLIALLHSLQLAQRSHEIFIVDNGSKDKTTAIISAYKKEYPEHIFPTFLSKNSGTTYPRNLALKQTTGRYIIIMDSDVEPHGRTITTLLSVLEKHKEVALVAPQLLYSDGRLQKSTDVFPTVFTKLCRYLFLRIIEKKERLNYREKGLRFVDYAISAMWVFRRETLETVGLLDEKIFYAPEDVDYCLRIWNNHYKVVYNPSASAIHHTQEITRGIKNNAATLKHLQGLLYYFRKHKYILRRPTVRQRHYGKHKNILYHPGT